MIFEQETMAFQILDVLLFDVGCAKKYSSKRNFDAISFRIEADTVVEYRNKQKHFTDNTVGFFPSNVDYFRTTTRDKMIVVHFKAFNYHTSDIESFVPQETEKYRILFEKLLFCWNEKEISYKHKAASILNNIFAEFYKDNKKDSTSDSKIARSLDYIEENCLKKDFSLEIAAEMSYVSQPYFRKLFGQKFGVSPKQYVINRRIKHAASLIIAGYYTLQEISDLCGYNDYKHFSVEFKKIFGVSPSKYVYEYDEKVQ